MPVDLPPNLTNAFQTLAVSLALGLLVGLQRERSDSRLAGFRTFALITLLGTIAAMLADRLGPWIVASGFLAVVITTAAGNIAAERQGDKSQGITTEIAILVMYAVGAMLWLWPVAVGVAIAAAVVLLLHLKAQLHSLARGLDEKDVHAIMQFVLISCIILPVLPDQTYGPFDVLNPRRIWWMVVLIVGLSLAGYVAFRLLGSKAGSILSGALGGLISSTATTVSAARRAANQPAQASSAILIIMLASTVLFIRLLIIASIVASSQFTALAPPFAIMLGVTTALCVFLWFLQRSNHAEPADYGNPSELKSALFFGGMYAVILFIVAAANHYFGDRGLYAVAAISGLTDMDAIAISTFDMTRDETVAASTAWRVVLVAVIANFVFKLGISWTLGGRTFAFRLAPWFAVAVAACATLILLWPADTPA